MGADSSVEGDFFFKEELFPDGDSMGVATPNYSEVLQRSLELALQVPAVTPTGGTPAVSAGRLGRAQRLFHAWPPGPGQTREESHGVVGESGSGKSGLGRSTCANMVLGLLKPDQGASSSSGHRRWGFGKGTGFIESFKARFRREQLSGEIMDIMARSHVFVRGMESYLQS
jgi:hypothetical protein